MMRAWKLLMLCASTPCSPVGFGAKLGSVVPAAPTVRVSDYAAALAPDARARLERILEEGEQTTGAQIVVAIFRSLEGERLEDFSIRLAVRWRVGR